MNTTTDEINAREMDRIRNIYTEPAAPFPMRELVRQVIDWDEDTTFDRLRCDEKAKHLFRCLVVSYFREAIDEIGEAMIGYEALIYDAHQAGDHAEAGNLQWRAMCEYVRPHMDELLQFKRMERQIERAEGREDDRFSGYEEA